MIHRNRRFGGMLTLACLGIILTLSSLTDVEAFLLSPSLHETSKKNINWTFGRTVECPKKCSKSSSAASKQLSLSSNDSNNDNDDKQSSSENKNPEQRRMEMVRSLQKSFYAPDAIETSEDVESSKTTTAATEIQNTSTETISKTQIQPQTGIVTDLPLWRVGWVEVPGRSSCLNVHEGQYTHMFETILSKPKPWYVGHLHLPGGFKMTRTDEYQYKLKNWSDELQDTNRFVEPTRSAVVGSLMEISDYRRLQDGRLVIFVHVLERFVVHEAVQEFPYSIAHVQILPDIEEHTSSGGDENFAKVYRASAVTKSFQYHDYEYAKIKLPLADDKEYLDAQSVANDEIAKLLPFAYYSNDKSLLKGDIEEDEEFSDSSSSKTGEAAAAVDSFLGGQPPLETQLLRGQILRNPKLSNKNDSEDERSIDAIETLLWLALEEFSLCTEFSLPQEVLCLIPPSMTGYMDLSVPNSSMLISCPNYPNLRRQKRLSFTAAAFLENTEFGMNLRQILLNMSSTKTRLAFLLERYEYLNDKIKYSMMGEFE